MSSGESDAVREDVPDLQEEIRVPQIKILNPGAPRCYDCEGPTQRAGACYVCVNCGSTTGCS